VLAVMAFLIATYLAFYQWRIVPDVWGYLPFPPPAILLDRSIYDNAVFCPMRCLRPGLARGPCTVCYNCCVQKTFLATSLAPVVLLSGRGYSVIKFGTLLLVFTGRLIAHDWLIVPGVRVGPVTTSSTEADLKAEFGIAAVKRAQIRINNKTTAPGLEIYGGKPGESLAVVWPRKDGALRWPLLVIPCYAQTSVDCRWRTADGVRVGTGVADLENSTNFPSCIPISIQALDRRLVGRTSPAWDGRRGKLADRLGEDVELQFETGATRQLRSGLLFVR
jgi:hypothetical protein